MLATVRQGLLDMAESDEDRVRLGFFDVVVFGHSAILIMHRLKTFDRAAFVRWFRPWEQELKQELKTDQLLKFFSQLRNDLVHGIDPSIGIVLTSYGQTHLRPGSITVDRPVPATHRGEQIQDRSMDNLCRLYADFLEAMFE